MPPDTVDADSDQPLLRANEFGADRPLDARLDCPALGMDRFASNPAQAGARLCPLRDEHREWMVSYLKAGSGSRKPTATVAPASE